MNMIDELEQVLRIEQEALLKGDFEALKELVERKQKLSHQLSQQRPDLPTETYRHLKDRAARNAALLTSAQRGLQAAMVQVRQAAEGAEQTTYSRTGERQRMSRTPASVTQKL